MQRDAATLGVMAVQEELAASLVRMLRGQNPRGLFDGEIPAVSAAPAAAAAGEPLLTPCTVLEEQGCNSLQQPQRHQPQPVEQGYPQGPGSRDVLLLLRRFSTAIGKAVGGQAEGLLRAAAEPESGAGAADALQDAAVVDRAISSLLFCVLQVGRRFLLQSEAVLAVVIVWRCFSTAAAAAFAALLLFTGTASGVSRPLQQQQQLADCSRASR